MVYSSFADNESGGSHFSGYLLAGALFAIPGAVIGGLIGSAAGRGGR